jgi:hypothetical protein
MDAPKRTQEARRLPWFGWLAAGTLVAGELGLLLGVRLVEITFYGIAWWSYILLVDACVWKRRGTSLLRDRPREFWCLAFWSVPVWNLFELFNFRLQNWCYVNAVPEISVAALLCFAAYATVLPGIFETYELLSAFEFAGHIRCRPLRISPPLLIGSMAAGLGMLIAPLLWPRYTFPLIWGFAAFLLDPLCYWAGPRRTTSLYGQLEQGDPRPFLRVLIAGLVCGGLWEFWNFWAYTKWLYTVPLFEEIKWFEMPPLGFLGFPAFAVECYVLVNLLNAARRGRGWECPDRVGPGVSRPVALVAVVAALVFSAGIYIGITRWTVSSSAPDLADMEGIPQDVLTLLAQKGVETPPALLSHTARADRFAALARETGVASENLRAVREAARLVDLKGLGAAHYNALRSLGIVTVEDLARQEPEVLSPRWRAAVSRRPPTLAQVRLWIWAARREVGS